MPAAAGLVLAGGRATRLGGGDKTLRTVGGRPMLSLVLERLSLQAGPLAISANGDPARFSAFGLPVLADDGPAGAAGPLAGILAGLEWASRATDQTWLLTVAGDTPFFPSDLAERLGRAAAGRRIAIARSGGRRHPVFGLWPVSIAADLRRFLAESRSFSVAAFLEGQDAAAFDFPMLKLGEAEADPFFNVNTPEDLVRAEAIARRLTG